MHIQIRLLLIFSISILLHFSAIAQDVTAFPDNRNNLQVFDRGLSKQLEYLPVKSYKIGGNSIAYIDNKNDFKIYYDGQTIQLLNAADFYYEVTNNLTIFSVGAVLYVFDKGEKKTLCYYTGYTSANDSILAYYDISASTLNFYYDGKIANVEESLLGQPKAIKTGSNTIAWINQSNIFSIFYHGQKYVIDNIAPVAFEAGQDIVAYIDDYERKFRIFYKGDTAIAESFLPDSFKVGFGICAYIDDLSNFNIFYDGKIIKVLSGRPDFFFVKGNVVIYYFNNMFNAFYKGQVYTLQNIPPASFQIGTEGIAWLDDSGRLKIFHKGKTSTVAYDVIESYWLNGNTLNYDIGNNSFRVWYNGRVY